MAARKKPTGHKGYTRKTKSGKLVAVQQRGTLADTVVHAKKMAAKHAGLAEAATTTLTKMHHKFMADDYRSLSLMDKRDDWSACRTRLDADSAHLCQHGALPEDTAKAIMLQAPERSEVNVGTTLNQRWKPLGSKKTTPAKPMKTFRLSNLSPKHKQKRLAQQRVAEDKRMSLKSSTRKPTMRKALGEQATGSRRNAHLASGAGLGVKIAQHRLKGLKAHHALAAHVNTPVHEVSKLANQAKSADHFHEMAVKKWPGLKNEHVDHVHAAFHTARAGGESLKMGIDLMSTDIMKSLGEADTVLGHTSKGKKIKVHGDYHGKFDAEDHEDAADLHRQVGDKLSSMASKWGQDKLPPAARRVLEKHAKHHRHMAAKHDKARFEKEKEGMQEKGSLLTSPSYPGGDTDKSPIFDAKSLTHDLFRSLRGAFMQAVADIRTERAATCPAHASGDMSKGVAGGRGLVTSACRCHDEMRKSAVAQRVTDKLLASARDVAAAKDLGIDIDVAWVEQIIDATQTDED